MKGYKKLAQGPDHDLSLATEQDEQPNEYGHGAERTASFTDPTNPFDGQSDPSTTTNADPTTTTTNHNNSGTIPSFEMDLGEPLAAETRMNRFRRTFLGNNTTLLVGCAAVLLAIVMLSMTVMKVSRQEPTTLSPRETLVHLVQSRLSSISFDSPTSPESKALDWMVHVDEFDHKAVSDDRLVQRFAMAAIAYSMRLDGESGMLTAESVCMWEDKNIEVLSCSDDSVVDSIQATNDVFENSSLPVVVELLTGLTTLNFEHNHLTGDIPTEIGLLTDITWLDLQQNDLSGTIPTEIGLLTSLTLLSLGGNHLSGTIPTEIGLLTGLTGLDLSINDLTGTIPNEIGLLVSLIELELNDNSLTGSLPTEIGLLTRLKRLAPYNNDLTGSLPTEIGLLTKLYILVFHSNELTGSIPTSIGLLIGLKDLGLHSNEFTGSIPSEIELLTGLRDLELYKNKVTGSIPETLCGHQYNYFLVDCDKITCSCCKDNERHHCSTN